MRKNSTFTITEVAQMLGMSRVAVFKKIKQGKLKAIKRDGKYNISKTEFNRVFDHATLTEQQKRVIDQGIKRTVAEYGEALRLLGQE